MHILHIIIYAQDSRVLSDDGAALLPTYCCGAVRSE